MKALQSEVVEIKKAISDIRETFAKREAMPNPILPPQVTPSPTINKPEPKPPKGIRVGGVPESTTKIARERNEHDMKEVKMLEFMSIDCEITEMQRIGPYQENRTRTIVFTVANRFHKRLILLSIAKLKEYDKKLCVSKELSSGDAKLERQLLKKRKKMLESNEATRRDLRFRDLKLYQISNEWKEVKIDDAPALS